MHRHAVFLLGAVLLLGSLPVATAAGDTTGRAAAPTFDEVPSAGDVVGGVVSISVTNTTDVGLVHIEVAQASDGTTWTQIANLSGLPWLHSWDTSTMSDGEHRLRLSPFEANGAAGAIAQSDDFTIDNTAPSLLSITIDGAQVGDGSSAVNRAWLGTASNGTLTIHWDASDANLLKATLSGAPGPGAPSADGPGPLLKRWDWTSGAFAEGTSTVTLTVHDAAGNTASRQLFMGIDRSGPSIGTPTLSQTPGEWTDSTVIHVQHLAIGASDGGGSGVVDYEWRFDDDAWTSMGAGGASSLTLPEGVHTLSLRAVDRLGNAGTSSDHEMWADHSAAVAGGWMVPDVTSSLDGAVPLTIGATDTLSGIDASATTLQYGFDADGLGLNPDITTRWLDFGSGLSASLPSSIDWSTKQGDWLALRAILSDVAGNQEATTVTFVEVTPGLDLAWDEVEIDRLIVAVGFSNDIHINATLTANEPFSGSVTVRMQQAPADRDASTEWTTIETRTVPAMSLFDRSERLEDWTVTMLAPGEMDLRLVIDPSDEIAERDEGNNEAFMIVNGARPHTIGAVTGFLPTIGAIAAVGIWLAWMMRRGTEMD